MDGIRTRFLFAYDCAKVSMFAAQLIIFIMASQPVKLFGKCTLGCSQECGIMNFRNLAIFAAKLAEPRGC